MNPVHNSKSPTKTNANRRHRLGKDGEDLAASYMVRNGFQVLERRYRRRGGEIDLICAPATVEGTGLREVVFVEVKTRAGWRFGRPEAAVSGKKKTRLKKTAEVFVHERGLFGIPARFDVIAIVKLGTGGHAVEHFVNAFGLHDFMDDDRWCEWRV